MSSATAPSPSITDRWFPTRKPLPDARLRLFCFCFAGGSASAFNGWAGRMPAGVELCAVQLPGRERRLMEKPFDNMPALLDALLPAMSPLMDMPFAFFGYSMGARISFELTRTLRARGAPLPRGLLLAASGPPRTNTRDPIHQLPDAQFIAELRRYGGTPEEIFQHKELLELLLPTLRADFALAWWANDPAIPRLDVPISAVGAIDDPLVPITRVEGWREETTHADFRARRVTGGHFFIRAQPESLLAVVREDLTRWMTAL